jgi:glycosyltransferase involved in cell wall biosynthesis
MSAGTLEGRAGGPATPGAGGRRPHVLFLGHDAGRTGAPIVLLHLLRWLRAHADLDLSVLLVDGGPLEDEYRALAPTWVVRHERDRPHPLDPVLGRIPGVRGPWRRRCGARNLAALRRRLRAAGPTLVVANTVATLPAVEVVDALGLPMILYVHELDSWIRLETGLEAFGRLKARAGRFVAVSEAVRRNLAGNHGIPPGSIDLAYEFVEARREPSTPRDERRRRLCEELGIDPASAVAFVGAAGTIDWRKGADLFVPLALGVERHRAGPGSGGPPAHYLWLGGDARSAPAARMRLDAERAGLGGRVHVLGSRPGGVDYIDLFDVFALTSREDPYPLVMLEAGSRGLPVVAFDGSGGAPEFIEDDAGFAVPYLDLDAMASAVARLLDDPALRSRLGDAARAKVRRRHDIDAGAARVFEIIRRTLDAAANPTEELAHGR